MDFDEVIKKRKMVREYQQDKQIPTDLINNHLSNAHRLPSAGYTQVQEFIIVIDPLQKGNYVKHHWDKVKLKMPQF